MREINKGLSVNPVMIVGMNPGMDSSLGDVGHVGLDDLDFCGKGGRSLAQAAGVILGDAFQGGV